MQKSNQLTTKESSALSNQVSSDLLKNQNSPQISLSGNIIHGSGFTYLNTVSDALSAPDILLSDFDAFIESFIPSIQLISTQANESFRKVCRSLKHVKSTNWKNYNFLYTDVTGKGSWIGISFRKKGANSAEFYSNHLKVAFQLTPDVFILEESESSSVLGIKQKHNSFYIVEKPRGLSRQDINSIFMICNAFTHVKINGQLGN